MTVGKRIRHILGISGGKDSAALAIFMRDKIEDIEYFFCDTGSELPEVYEYLQKLEIFLGKKITMLNSGKTFEHYLSLYKGTLPSPQMRWCTNFMKIKPIEEWIGDDESEIYTYIGIRADENRSGYISSKSNVHPVYPFKENNMDKNDIMGILEKSGIGVPAYYDWRTRSGCYFCFFQRKIEWVGLSEKHPDLFEKAVAFEEKVGFEDSASSSRYTWSKGESLRELVARKEEIKAKHQERLKKEQEKVSSKKLFDLIETAIDEEDDTPMCEVCQ
jgi:3'-phosphoadenosine 5'-phosphosulfate sulfotransferase (PAPS reductase)/FAD synthetase